MRVKGFVENPLLLFSNSNIDPVIKKWINGENKVFFTITGEGVLSPTVDGSVLKIDGEQLAEVMLETWYKRRTLNQLNTLKAVESLIYQIDYGRKPTGDDLDDIHEGILEHANFQIKNEFTGAFQLLRSSHKLCTTVHMNRFIEVAFEMLLERPIPEDIVDAIFKRPLSEIFKLWYEHRFVEDDLDKISWVEYRERFPYCEFTMEMGTDFDPTERMHIISAGSDKGVYEFSWNWFHAKRSIHKLQHDKGWAAVITRYPHVKEKINRAKRMHDLKRSEK